jgi:hypothetical protein
MTNLSPFRVNSELINWIRKFGILKGGGQFLWAPLTVIQHASTLKPPVPEGVESHRCWKCCHTSLNGHVICVLQEHISERLSYGSSLSLSHTHTEICKGVA